MQQWKKNIAIFHTVGDFVVVVMIIHLCIKKKKLKPNMT